jgi:hypothetical protein
MDVSFTPGVFTQGMKAASTRWVEDLVGFKAVLDVVCEGRILTFAWNRTPA